jgi:hypothetical protein
MNQTEFTALNPLPQLNPKLAFKFIVGEAFEGSHRGPALSLTTAKNS